MALEDAGSEKVRVFLWVALHNSLQVNAYRFKCNLSGSPACSRCSAPEEDQLHCLRDCPHSREVWLRFGALSWGGFVQANFGEWVSIQARKPMGTLFIACL